MSSLRDIYKKSFDDYNDKIKNKPKPPRMWPGILLGGIIMACGVWRGKYVNDNSDIIGVIIIIIGFIIFSFGFFRGWGEEKIIARDRIKKFICHNCLKSVLVEKLDFQCPFCETKYGELSNNASKEEVDSLLGLIAKSMIISADFEQKEAALFDKCGQCDRKIQFVECYYCHKPINLFAPYNKEELEAKVYV